MTEQSPPGIELFDQLPIGAFSLSVDLRTIRVNRHFAEYIGVAPGVLDISSITGLQSMDRLGEEWARAGKRAMLSGQIETVEFPLMRTAGFTRLSLRMSPLRDATGMLLGLVCVAVDISATLRVESALHDAEQRFQAFMDHLPVCAWVKNEDGRHEFLNKVYRERFAIGSDWRGKTDTELWPRELAEHFRRTDLEVTREGRSQEYEQTVLDPEEQQSHWWIHKFPFHDGGGRRLTGGIAMDITERRDLEVRLRESEARFQAFLDHSPALAWMKDEQGRYLFMSRSYIEFLGLSEGGWRGLTDADLYPDDFAQRSRDQEIEVLNRGRAQEFIGAAPDASGRQREWLLVRFPFSDGTGRQFIGGVATDITERRRAEEQVRLQAITDELTGLYNRRGFWLLSEQEYRLACRRQLRCMLILLDLDGLKLLNDCHGHDAGDQALIAMAEALRVATRNSDIIGRIGGDEFILFAVDCDDADALQERLLAAIDSCNEHGALRASISASLGIVDFTADAAVPLDQLIAEADARMYETKRNRARAAAK